jgi:CheY-like chemotaxis protein
VKIMAEQDDTMECLRVLLVEDSMQEMDLIRGMLQDMGVTQIYTAKQGLEALEIMGVMGGSDAVDLILCDWNMPEMSGIEFLKRVREDDPDLAFLMITGVSNQDAVAEAISLGVTGYIKKPFSADDLKKKLLLVSRILAHRERAAADR